MEKEKRRKIILKNGDKCLKMHLFGYKIQKFSQRKNESQWGGDIRNAQYIHTPERTENHD